MRSHTKVSRPLLGRVRTAVLLILLTIEKKSSSFEQCTSLHIPALDFSLQQQSRSKPTLSRCRNHSSASLCSAALLTVLPFTITESFQVIIPPPHCRLPQQVALDILVKLLSIFHTESCADHKQKSLYLFEAATNHT